MVERKSFGKIPKVLDLPDLVEVQLESFDQFLQPDLPPDERENQGLEAIFQEVFPIEDYHRRYTLEYISYSLGRPKYEDGEALRKGVTYAAPLKASLRLISREKEEAREPKNIIEQEVYLGDLPLMTERGTFVVNGVERVVVSQLHRSPGVYFKEEIHPSGKRLISAQMIPYRGSWLEFFTDANGILWVNLDRRRKLFATTLIRGLGYSTIEEILKIFFPTKTVKLPESEAALDNSDLLGKVLSTDIFDMETGEILANAGGEITDELLAKLCSSGLASAEVVDKKESGGLAIIRNTLAKDQNRSEKEALERIYLLLRGSLPPSLEAAKSYFSNLFFSGRRYDLSKVGRYKINQRLNLQVASDIMTLTREDILETIRAILKLEAGEGMTDDIDHLGNRRLRRVGELLASQFSIALSRAARSIREKMVLRDTEDLTPQGLMNVRLIQGVVMGFFAGSQLSQFLEQTNPLAELTHKRRLSALGPGGLTRETAGFEVRDVHYSHYGRICPIETPEGPNIGLIVSLSTFARVNQYGFIETPYRRVSKGGVTKAIQYLPADLEDQYTIAQANAPLDKRGRLVANLVLSRKRGGFPVVSPEEVDYMDVSPMQLVSAAAALIPFLEHDDANRALMGSNMQRQAVPLLIPRAPTVGTGIEEKVARDSGAVVLARRGGAVSRVTAEEICVLPDGEGGDLFEENVDRYPLTKFKRTNQDTCMNQRPLVREGDRLEGGEVIADGPATENGELALGSNVLVAFMPWGGYNFEDAIVVSERLLKEDMFTSIHVEEFECQVRETKLGPEEITREIPNVGEDTLKDLDEHGIIRIGAEVFPDDILVGKVSPKGETELTPEERLLRAIFGERASDVRDSSLRVPSGVSGVVVDVRVFSRKGLEERAGEAEKEVSRIRRDASRRVKEIESRLVEALSKTLVGKKAKHTLRDAKGRVVVKKGTAITGEHLARIDFDEIVISSGVFGRSTKKVEAVLGEARRVKEAVVAARDSEIEKVKRGDELPHGVIKLVKVFVAQKRTLSVGDKMSGRHGNKGVIATIVPEEDMPYLADGTPVEIVLNPLGVPSRMNVGQILEAHLGWAAHVLGMRVASPVFDGASISEIKEELEKAGLPLSGKTVLYDGRTGLPFGEEITVGYIYMMKLSHMVDDKIHARSIGPYSLITQQPLGGKAQFGGQRFGEMEVWALEAYGAAYTLQEMLTVKSDDIQGRTKVYETIIKGENPPEPGLPASFNVLMKELNGLGLEVELEKEQ